MRRTVLGGVLAAAVACHALVGWGQMHKVEAKEKVVRAIGVYEWTGDLAKPKGERLVPVTIFIDGEVQDAGVYLARPIPMALQPGNLYELDDAGAEKGLLDLKVVRHVQIPAGANLDPYDDGWFGYGSFEAPKVPKALPTKKPTAKLMVNGKEVEDPDKPHFSSKDAKPGDAEKPEPGSPEDVKVDAGKEDDADNVDRPTLRRRPAVDPKQAKKDRKARDESSVVAEKGSLNDDADRPTLKRGSGKDSEDDLPPLNGLPADMHQMVAVSDAKRREMHPFARAWEDEAERVAVLGKMRELARAELVKYGPVPKDAVTMVAGAGSAGTPYAGVQPGAAAATPTGPALASQDTSGGAPVLRRNTVGADEKAKEQVTAPVTAPVAAAPARAKAGTAPAAKTPAARRAAVLKAKKEVADAKSVSEALVGEELKGFTLSYGGAPTFVYTAHTAGQGAALRYVTIVAQREAPQNEYKVAMRGVTDAAHLDRTAWMRFVDVVDVEASNRASLLFELRGQSSRQFGLYRVIGGKADTVFLGGTTQ